MQIVWSSRACGDLAAIRDYVAQDKPAAAARLARKILAAAESLTQHPHLGRPGREPDTRELIVAGTPYILPYKIHRGRLAILAVVHAAREYPAE